MLAVEALAVKMARRSRRRRGRSRTPTKAGSRTPSPGGSLEPGLPVYSGRLAREFFPGDARQEIYAPRGARDAAADYDGHSRLPSRAGFMRPASPARTPTKTLDPIGRARNLHEPAPGEEERKAVVGPPLS